MVLTASHDYNSNKNGLGIKKEKKIMSLFRDDIPH